MSLDWEFRHHMLREIHEMPRAVRDTLVGRVSNRIHHIF
jgi:glucosamine 6-phosphate synthetase-like amidotransferase/phosphosugar isomerase protein